MATRAVVRSAHVIGGFTGGRAAVVATGAVGGGSEAAVVDLGATPGGGGLVAALAVRRSGDVAGTLACSG